VSEPAEPIVVHEFKDSKPIRLSVEERDALGRIAPAMSVKPVAESSDLYVLNPGNRVGALQLGRHRFELRPKLPIRRVLFLLSYSLHGDQWRDESLGFETQPDLFEAVIHGFASQLERALLLGPLQGYRYEEQALQTIRGRIRFNDHIRTRFGLVPPIECGFDEFTEDIEINRLLKAALVRLGEIRMRSDETRRRLRILQSHFANVSSVLYDSRAIPLIRFDRRTEPYRGPVELARFILRSYSVDARSGEVASSAFLINMATVFEEFVALALGECLQQGVGGELVRHAKGRDLYLDAGRKLRLEPDLSWWEHQKCLFVGDVKYKRTRPIGGVQHPDAYQLLAYTTAAQRRRGLLVYAKSDDHDEGDVVPNGVLRIPGAEKMIEVRALSLDAPPEAVLRQIGDLAADIRDQIGDQSLVAA
jgi:5-methylcytosine-specific restriction enzyme subunit McrC